jgi:uncharacterized membrane protein
MLVNMNRKRLGIAILSGALLGILCIIGVGLRLPGGYFANWVFLIGMWYNRVIMGLVIGLADEIVVIQGENSRVWANAIVRGLLFGLIVSAAIFLSTEFRDIPAFFAGIIYGIIIDLVSTALSTT